MTTKAYLDDSYTMNFSATVLSCMEAGEQFHLILDKTYFYPEGGGQPTDIGSIGGIDTFDVRHHQNEIIHITNAPIKPGAKVECQVNRTVRMDYSSQHTGQHLLSAVLDKSYGAATVGFHLTKDNLTIDIDRTLTNEDYLNIERSVNSLIRENRKMLVHYPDTEDLESYSLRKTPKVRKDIRLVEIEGYDTVPCGGTHLNRTGEVGSFKIRKIDKYKSGQRISFCCAKRATDLSILEHETVTSFITKLSAPLEELPQSLDAILDRIDQMNRKLIEFEMKAIDSMAAAALEEATTIHDMPFVSFWFEDLSQNAFKALLSTVTEGTDGLIVAANFDDGSGQLIIHTGNFSSRVNAKELMKRLQSTYDLKGGGSPQRAQGGTKDIKELSRAFEAAKRILADG
ncbi:MULTISPECIES: DHHA1 domain-containing protein [unclassified Fusibacter]|uniref:alanyl-tRNA editing protein n=1 Tax=unclassified Fusibacter TaxID=2624464 RepID=UPI001010EA10|nr:MULTISPECIES: DHHA1 domain-containing protein [unclassified Fusibacter]MCK8060697.1 DHHA1 domain-containing protein [Fusibacter sp. A2]NPE22849.1 hypothetical protein [Fusibacter sp. A1]RXV59918.1 hypothetical protein DWB64_13465 [Fusibacter sp. A1]